MWRDRSLSGQLYIKIMDRLTWVLLLIRFNFDICSMNNLFLFFRKNNWLLRVINYTELNIRIVAVSVSPSVERVRACVLRMNAASAPPLIWLVGCLDLIAENVVDS